MILRASQTRSRTEMTRRENSYLTPALHGLGLAQVHLQGSWELSAQDTPSAYYILQGEARVDEGGTIPSLGPGDVISLPTGSRLTIIGNVSSLSLHVPGPEQPRPERPHHEVTLE